MRRLVAVTAFLLVMSPSPAADDAKPNMLTSKEIAEGWLLLFDAKTPFGWKAEGEAQIVDGTGIVGGDRDTTVTTTSAFVSSELTLQYRQLGDKREARLEWEAMRASLSAATAKEQWHDLSLRSGGAGDVPGAAPIRLHVPAGSKIAVRNVKLKPLGLTPLFNGKDLTGWKEFPGRNSQFSVSPAGTLDIKNGPGDLQTESQWDDFILQIECKTNADRLNSGVFFRCRPGEYQNGYEAQIHNGFLPEPGKDYTLDVYDPQTHQLTGERMVKYTAMDYGTGAIYRRQPARFEVAKDREWFTMTVLAQGKHMAVWVNGILVTDWTDHRPANDNARNGYRQEKGPISLQGHDPTTNLSFRNIRIAPLTPGGRKN